jgi:putative glutamine amidotransferase
MSATQPLKIGLSSCFFHADPSRPIFKGKTLLYLEESLAHWVMSQGVLSYMIPSVPKHAEISLKDLAAPLDGLVLQGGSDVSPKSYGESPLKPEWGGDYLRDQYEMALLREFGEQGKPVLGICRGAQLVNVAFGGSLYQDIPSQLPDAAKHRDWGIYDQNFHTVNFEPGSRLEELYPGTAAGRVNSIHHQAIKHLGKGLLVEARAPDDMIEAVRSAQGPYVYALQWHPEFHDHQDASLMSGLPVLRDFLAQAQKTRGASHA